MDVWYPCINNLCMVSIDTGVCMGLGSRLFNRTLRSGVIAICTYLCTDYTIKSNHANVVVTFVLVL